MFPHHQVPDGSVALPHHLTWSLLLALIALWVASGKHPEKQPVMSVTAVVIALLSFLLVWPTHHTLGALLAVSATIVTISVLAIRLGQSVFVEDSGWPPLPLLVALVLSVIALDDVLQHAFGWTMPLDWFWDTYLRPRLPSHR